MLFLRLLYMRCIFYMILHQSCNLLHILWVDVDSGAAEEGEANHQGVGAVGVGADFAFKASKVASDYADGVVDAEFSRRELDGGVGLAEHEFQLLDFRIADDGHWLVEATAIS